MPERSLVTLQAEFCGGAGAGAPVSNGVSSFATAAAQLPVQAGGNGALGAAATNGFSGGLSGSLPQVCSLALTLTDLA